MPQKKKIYLLNPYKKLSKVNPQIKDGHRRINNDVYLQLIAAPLTAAESKVVHFIINQTWGYGDLSAAISVSWFTKYTKLSGRAVRYALRNLKEKKLIYSEDSNTRVQAGSPLKEYLFNKHWDTWVVEGCKLVQGVQAGSGGARDGRQGCKTTSLGVQAASPIKESIKQDLKEKEVSTEAETSSPSGSSEKPKKLPKSNLTIEQVKESENPDCKLVALLVELMRGNNENVKIAENLFPWVDTCRVMREKDNRTHEGIEAVIRFSQQDDFWQYNILSMPTLREKYDQLWGKIQREKKTKRTDSELSVENLRRR